MDEKKARNARKYGRTLADLKSAAQRQGWALLPLVDSDGTPLRIFAVGKLDDVAALQEILHDASNQEDEDAKG